MLRDLTMIFSVLVSLVSLAFGIFKNIEAGNARGFAYEQAYRVMGVVEEADIGPIAKANILSAALGVIGTPPPAIDLSRSSADAPPEPGACPPATLASCVRMASDLAELNASCRQSGAQSASCEEADGVKADIDAASCIACFTL